MYRIVLLSGVAVDDLMNVPVYVNQTYVLVVIIMIVLVVKILIVLVYVVVTTQLVRTVQVWQMVVV